MSIIQPKQSEFHLFNFDIFDEIYLIDDEPGFLFLNEMILKFTHPNIKRVSINNINDAFIHLQSQPDVSRLVLLDIHIGMTTGFELLDMLSSIALINTKVIMHSSCNEVELVQKAFSYPLVKAFIVKPLSIEIIELISGADILPENPAGYSESIIIKTNPFNLVLPILTQGVPEFHQ